MNIWYYCCHRDGRWLVEHQVYVKKLVSEANAYRPFTACTALCYNWGICKFWLARLKYCTAFEVHISKDCFRILVNMSLKYQECVECCGLPLLNSLPWPERQALILYSQWFGRKIFSFYFTSLIGFPSLLDLLFSSHASLFYLQRSTYPLSYLNGFDAFRIEDSESKSKQECQVSLYLSTFQIFSLKAFMHMLIV